MASAIKAMDLFSNIAPTAEDEYAYTRPATRCDAAGRRQGILQPCLPMLRQRRTSPHRLPPPEALERTPGKAISHGKGGLTQGSMIFRA